MARKSKSAGSGDVTINMTPMIDCTFQLIIFFILTSGIASSALAKLEVPKPYKSMAVEGDQMQVRRIIVNVVPYYDADYKGAINPANVGMAGGYVINNVKVDVADQPRLVRILKERAAEAQELGLNEFYVEIRGDKSVNYRYVVPVMLAAAEAGIPKMTLTALIDR